jgi:Ca2+-binding RTX toxin-like protein
MTSSSEDRTTSNRLPHPTGRAWLWGLTRPIAWLVVGAVTIVPAADAGAGPADSRCFSKTPTVIGTPESEELEGTSGADVIAGLGGDDVISGGGGADLICAGDGFDFVDGGIGFDRLSGDAGDDTLHGRIGVDALFGRTGIDALFGEAGDDRIMGGPNEGFGIEGLLGGLGDDILDGGPGLDAALYFDAGRAVAVDLGAGLATGEGADRIVEVEGVVGSNFDDLLVGDAGGNGLFGQRGADTIRGRGSGTLAARGFDVLAGDGGADRIVGGPGFDMAAYDRVLRPVTVNLAAGVASGQGHDALEAIEGVIGSVFDDVVIGDVRDNAFAGGDGNDNLDGGDGFDTAIFADVGGSVTVNLAAGQALGAGTDVLGAIENVWGSGGDDLLLGDEADNGLFGFAGNDDLRGALGDDLLAGGAGPDRADGGGGFDVCLSARATIACETTEAPHAMRMRWPAWAT